MANRRSVGLAGCIAVLSLQVAAVPLHAQPADEVFRIGTFDRSSGEFSQHQPKTPVNFIVGRSTAKDWYASQPVALLASPAAQPKPDAATAPRTITFSLQHAPAAEYLLHISVLLESACVPALRATIDDRHGTFSLHPKLDYSNGDQGDSFYPAYASAEVAFAIPGAYLRQGANTISFQAVKEATDTVPDASLNYDAVELDRATGKAPRSSVQVVPTIFFEQQAGALAEDIDVFLRHSAPVTQGTPVGLTVGGRQYRQAISNSEDFGDEKLTYRVAQFAANSLARVDWDGDGERLHDEQRISPEKKWTLFLVPHIHVDVGFSDYQAKIAAIQSQTIDEAMKMMEAHPDFRFSLDGEWDLEQFLETRSPADQARVVKAMQDHRLFLPAQYANLLTGFPTAETLIRSLYPSANFSRLHGIPFDYANLTDVPSYSWSYASILAAAEIHNLLGGSNNYRAPVLLQGRLNEDSPVWWQGPDGGRVLLWYSRIYQQMQMLFGLPPLVDAGRDTLPLFLQQYERPGYHAEAAILYGSQVENTDLFPQQAELAGRWNGEYAYPRLQYSGFHDALEEIARQFGSAIPTIHGDGGPYWEDGIASDAHYAAIERWNEPRALSAEKLDTLSTLVDPLIAADTGRLDRLWKDMVLMDEHTWGAYDSVSSPGSMQAVQQLAVKDSYAVNAQALADFVVRSSMANLARSIRGGPGTLLVFNTLNWRRSGLVSVDLPDGYALAEAGTGNPVPYAVLSNGNGFRHVQFVAEQVPPVGYKRYLLKLSAASPPAAAMQHTDVLESPFYRVTLDPASGAIRSIYDKQLQRELVDQGSAYRFGQYLYVSGGDEGPNTLLQYSRVYPAAQLAVHGAAAGSLVSVERTPSGAVARMRSADTNTPSIQTEVRLFDHEKKIELIENVDKEEVLHKEAVYFAFPFAMQQPRFQYEVQNGVVDPAKDMYPGAGHEWFSVQHWVAAEQDGVSAAMMPLDAPLVTLGDINRGAWPMTFGRRSGTIFSYVMNNYWDTNYRAAQGGAFSFHYVITSAPSTDPAALSRMGWEAVTPLETDEVTTQDKSITLPESAYVKAESFLDVPDPDLLFDTWKRAEDGNGTVLRFLDLGGAERTVTVRMPAFHLRAAWKTDAVERDGAQLPLVSQDGFTYTVHPHEIVTVRVVGQ